MTYDPVNDPCGPAIRGVAVGMHADGTVSFIFFLITNLIMN